MSVVRISLAHFDASLLEEVRKRLIESQETLVPALKALRGNIGYYVGIDATNNSMTNVSIWETLEDANQMASLKEMQALAVSFSALGVQFDRPITNHEVLWTG